MERFLPFLSPFILLDSRHIDTDQIIPARFLKQTHKQGLGEALFFDWRHAADGNTPGYELNQRAKSGVKILVAAENFGCGSSREHAVWALNDYGFRAILSPSFGDIFKGNALKNGLLPIEVSEDFLGLLREHPQEVVSIDLETCSVELVGIARTQFEVDAFARFCMLEGVDQLEYVLKQNHKVEAFEARREGI